MNHSEPPHVSISMCLCIPGTEEPGGLPSMGSQSRTRLVRLGGSSMHTYSFPPNKHFPASLLSTSLWKSMSAELAGQGPTTGHGPWWPSASVLSLPLPNLDLWPRTLLQANSGQSHRRSVTFTFFA